MLKLKALWLLFLKVMKFPIDIISIKNHIPAYTTIKNGKTPHARNNIYCRQYSYE